MELITTASFQNLTKTEQVGMVMVLGKNVLKRVSDGYSIHLYILSNIFIEVWYKKKSNNIVKLKITNRDDIVKNYGSMNDLVHYLFNDDKQ